jgi:hypothetical protein
VDVANLPNKGQLVASMCAMNEARKVVFHSARQEDAQQKLLEQQARRAEFTNYLSIIMSIILILMLFAALSMLMGLWQAPGPTLISAL